MALTDFTLSSHSWKGLARAILDDSPDEIALVGHSFGGYVALEMVRQAPERITHLALLSTQATPDTQNRTRLRESQIKTAEEESMHRLGLLLVMLAHPRNQGLVTHHCREIAREHSLEAFKWQQESMINRHDTREALMNWGKLKRPALILSGKNDPYIGWGQHEELYDLIKQGSIQGEGRKRHFNRLVAIENCGQHHLLT